MSNTDERRSIRYGTYKRAMHFVLLAAVVTTAIFWMGWIALTAYVVTGAVIILAGFLTQSLYKGDPQ